jgi:hypothetical protein
MSPLATLMLVGTLVAWAECVVWYFRRRSHDPRRVSMTVQQLALTVLVLGFIAPYLAGIRLLVWAIRNGVEWIGQPVATNARARMTRRRQIRRARQSPVGAAVVQQLPPGRPVLALPASPQSAPVHALGESELVSAPDGSVTMVTRMSDGSSRVMPVLQVRAS